MAQQENRKSNWITSTFFFFFFFFHFISFHFRSSLRLLDFEDFKKKKVDENSKDFGALKKGAREFYTTQNQQIDGKRREEEVEKWKRREEEEVEEVKFEKLSSNGLQFE